MKRTRSSLAMVLCAVLLTISCGPDSPTAARAPTPPANDLLGGVTTLLGGTTKLVGSLLTCQKLPEASNSQLIGPSGGQLQIGPHTLTVPAGALHSWVQISGVAPSSKANIVQLYPEGLQFSKPAALTMSYAHCGLVAGLLPRIAYVDDDLLILNYVPSLNNLFSRTVTGQIPHFSGYATAW